MTAQDLISAQEPELMAQLFDWLRIPSISANSEYKQQTHNAATWLQQALVKAGADKTEIWPTPGHAVVYAEKIVDPALPTLLVYGHYDVQPPEPLELWTTPAFEPTIRDGKIYARGAADDKGQAFLHVAAFALLQQQGKMPCNLKFMIEGEEEVGSPNLAEVIRTHKEQLKCDAIVISDTSMLATDTPSITVALRGLTYIDVSLTGFDRDLHSGMYGGAVDNPINALCGMIAKLKDENGHITVPGLYDDARQFSAEERAELNKCPFDEKEFMESIGARALKGEKGYTPVEHMGIRPCLDVNGIWGGYTGEGSKTVLPAKAHAKISMRLSPGQDYRRATELLTKYLYDLCPPTMTLTVDPHHGGEPVLTDITGPAYQAAVRAVQAVWNKTPIPTYEGGSIPISATMQREISPELIFLGFGLDSDALHSPDESFSVEQFRKGIATLMQFYQEFGKTKR